MAEAGPSGTSGAPSLLGQMTSVSSSDTRTAEGERGSRASNETTAGTPTILSTLHALLDNSPLTSSAYAHPYAPAKKFQLHPLSGVKGNSKGKERAPRPDHTHGVYGNRSEQERMLRDLRGGLRNIRDVLARSSAPNIARGPEALAGGLDGRADTKALAEGGGGGRDERERIVRAMKDVATHQATLLPLLPHLPPPRHSLQSSPCPIIPLAPIEFLTSLSSKLGIETYLEDSQFGLLKTSLAIAGKRFVVDVDVEMDGAEGDDADVEEAVMQPPSLQNGTTMGVKLGSEGDKPGIKPSGNGPSIGGRDQMEGRGRIRLTKLTASHVTDSPHPSSSSGGGGGSGRSDWVAFVLRELMEEYIDAWNVNGNGVDGSSDEISAGQAGAIVEKDGWERLEEAGGRLAQEMGDLAWLDKLCADASAAAEADAAVAGSTDVAGGEANKGATSMETGRITDWFGELETKAVWVKKMINSKSVFPASATIFPTFKLLQQPIPNESDSSLPLFSSTRSEMYNPSFRIRPARVGENIPNPLATRQRQQASPGDRPTDRAGLPVNPSRERTFSDWVMEFVPDDRGTHSGLIVQQHWTYQDEPTTSDLGIGGKDTAPAGSVPVEQLLYAPAPSPSKANLSGVDTNLPFPYAGTFAHRPAAQATSDPRLLQALEQRWSVVRPGPAGYVVGRVGTSGQQVDLEKLCRLLRAQVIYSAMVQRILDPRRLIPEETIQRDETEGGEDEDDDEEDLDDLMSAPTAIPLTLDLYPGYMTASMPLPHHSSGPIPPTLILTFRVDVASLRSPSTLVASDHETQPEVQAPAQAPAPVGGREDVPFRVDISWDLQTRLQTKSRNELDTAGRDPNAAEGIDEMQAGILDAAVSEGSKGGWDLVDVVRRVEGVLRG